MAQLIASFAPPGVLLSRPLRWASGRGGFEVAPLNTFAFLRRRPETKNSHPRQSHAPHTENLTTALARTNIEHTSADGKKLFVPWVGRGASFAAAPAPGLQLSSAAINIAMAASMLRSRSVCGQLQSISTPEMAPSSVRSLTSPKSPIRKTRVLEKSQSVAEAHVEFVAKSARANVGAVALNERTAVSDDESSVCARH